MTATTSTRRRRSGGRASTSPASTATSTTSRTTTACTAATRAARRVPRQEFGDSARPRVPGERRRQHARHHDAARRLPRDGAQPPADRPPSRHDRQRRDARPGPSRLSDAAGPVLGPGVRRRPLPVLVSPRVCCGRRPRTALTSPARTPTTASTWGTSTRRARSPGSFAQTITVRTAGSPAGAAPLPLTVGRSRVSALTITPPRRADAGVPALGQPDRL